MHPFAFKTALVSLAVYFLLADSSCKSAFAGSNCGELISLNSGVEIQSIKNRNTLFVIRSNQVGVDVSAFEWKKENEVLFAPESNFLVMKVVLQGEKTVICMRAIP